MKFNEIKKRTAAVFKEVTARVRPGKVRCFGVSDPGLKRENNEDAFLMVTAGDKGCDTGKLGNLFVVADGMGGHAAGETASRMACQAMRVYYRTREDPAEHVEETLARIIEATSRKILDHALKNPALSGMGTTLSVLVLRSDKAIIAHVGDSRIYRLRSTDLEQLTKDHTQVQVLVEMGRLTQEEALTHPMRHVITHAVGTRKGHDDIFTSRQTVLPGDRFLMCSDGLHDMVAKDVIEQSLSSGRSPETICKDLLDKALENGGGDNVTILCIFA